MEMLPYFLLLIFLAISAPVLGRRLCALGSADVPGIAPGLRARILFSSAIVSLAGAVAALLTITQAWNVVRVETFFSETYYDMRSRTRAAECFSQTKWPEAFDVCIGNWLIPHDPVIWGIFLGTLGVTDATTEALALASIALFILALGVIAFMSTANGFDTLQILFIAVAAVAPPQLFLYYLGNTELFIFSLVTACLFILAHSARGIGQTAGTALLTVTMYLKAITLGAALSLLACRATKRRRLTLFFTSLTVACVLLIWELQRVYGDYPQSWKLAFGSGILPARALSVFNPEIIDGIYFSTPWPRVIGFGIWLTMSAFLLFSSQRFWKGTVYLSLRQSAGSLVNSPPAALLFLAGSGIYLFNFLVNTSFDYRLIFLIPLIAGCVATPTKRPHFLVVVACASLATMFVSNTRYPILGWLGWSYYEIPGDLISFVLAVLLGPLMLMVVRGILSNTPAVQKTS